MKEKILNKSNLIYAVMPLAMIYYEIILKFLTESGRTHFFYPILFGLTFGLFVDFILMFLKKSRYLAITLITFIVSVMYIAEALIKKTFQTYMSFGTMLQEATNVVGNYGGELIASILGGLLVIGLFLIPTILVLVLHKQMKETPVFKYRRVLGALVIIFVLVSHFSALIGPYSKTYGSEFEFNGGVETLGMVASIKCQLLPADEKIDVEKEDPKKEEEEKKEEKEEEQVFTTYNKMDIDDKLKGGKDSKTKNLNEYVKSQKATLQNKYTGLFKGKNVILICAEAYSDKVVDKELTPALYRLTHNGFYFSNFYQPSWGGSTTAGEYSFMTGLMPKSGATSMQETKKCNMYFTIGNQLQRLKYYNTAYHNGMYNYYSRDKTHQNLGYDAYYGRGNGLNDICKVKGYITDKEMFDGTFKTYVDHQPFSIYYMSVDGHASFVNNTWQVKKYMKKVEARWGDKYSNKVKYYLCKQMALEDGLASLLKHLEDAGIIEDTVIAMTADHYPYALEKSSTYKNDKNYAAELRGKSYSSKDMNIRDRNGGIIWCGSLETTQKEYACEIKDPCYSLDIVPTLSNLLGLKYDSRLLPGRDVFSEAEPLVLWNNGNFVTDKGVYSGGKFKAKEGVEVSDDYVKKMKKKVNQKMNYSKKVVESNYWGYLFGKDAKERDNKKYFNSDYYKKEKEKKAEKKNEEKKKEKKEEETTD